MKRASKSPDAALSLLRTVVTSRLQNLSDGRVEKMAGMPHDE